MHEPTLNMFSAFFLGLMVKAAKNMIIFFHSVLYFQKSKKRRKIRSCSCNQLAENVYKMSAGTNMHSSSLLSFYRMNERPNITKDVKKCPFQRFVTIFGMTKEFQHDRDE